ncbi:MAG: hypothetical protein PHD01_06065 [Geobacteraceae bacterium]|nr:hypothetical protein [Geobacteraceae bacterium]
MQLLDFLIADDIRHELGNKFSIMGIFTDVFGLSQTPKWPLNIKVGVFIRLKVEGKDKKPDSFKLVISHELKKVAEAVGNFTINDQTKTINIPLILNPLPIPNVGLLTFALEIFSSGESVFKTKNQLNIVTSQAPPVIKS